MQTTVSRWGNSLGIRLPKEAVDSINIAEGDRLTVTVSDGAITLTRARRRYTIEELCATMTDENAHPPMFDDFVGNERLWEHE